MKKPVGTSVLLCAAPDTAMGFSTNLQQDLRKVNSPLALSAKMRAKSGICTGSKGARGSARAASNHRVGATEDSENRRSPSRAARHHGRVHSGAHVGHSSSGRPYRVSFRRSNEGPPEPDPGRKRRFHPNPLPPRRTRESGSAVRLGRCLDELAWRRHSSLVAVGYDPYRAEPRHLAVFLRDANVVERERLS